MMEDNGWLLIISIVCILGGIIGLFMWGEMMSKFKDQDALQKAYESLEKEFTRRSQQLRELQRKIENGALREIPEKAAALTISDKEINRMAEIIDNIDNNARINETRCDGYVAIANSKIIAKELLRYYQPIDFDERFISLVTKVKTCFDCIKELKDYVDEDTLEDLYNSPQYILEVLEDESGVNWDDNIWNLIYNGSKDQIKDVLYEVKKLKLINDSSEESNVKRYKQKILDLLLDKGLMPYEAISLINSRITERNIFDWKTKYPNIETLVEDLLIGRSDD